MPVKPQRQCLRSLRAPAALTVGGLALWLLSGCTHIVAHTTPYYEDGPSQVESPQGNLSAGTRVWLIGHEGSYAHVLTWTLDAYVFEADLEPAWHWPRAKKQESSDQPAWNEITPESDSKR